MAAMANVLASAGAIRSAYDQCDGAHQLLPPGEITNATEVWPGFVGCLVHALNIKIALRVL